ncbi:MAG: hypothetical protein JO261_11380 [Alphaproteobacteria bacterium]|nr:hypothetical protein [Alphaproteobacteria bacterium]MBV9694290.1 hypothetical protein [Alphaproteobacteria bacterium]
MTFNGARFLLILLATPVMLAGCATYDFVQPPPPQSQPIAVTFSSTGPSGWTDLPIGTYRIPNSAVIVSGQQRGNGVMFGLLGVLLADSVGSAAGKHRVGSVQSALLVDLVPEASTLTQQAIASGRYGQAFAAAPVADSPTLEVDPYTVLTYSNDTDVRPAVILKATLKPGGTGAKPWTTRYMAFETKATPLTGDNSLTANDGALLKSAIERDLRRAVNAMLDDIATRRGRDKNNLIYLETALPFVRERFALTGAELSDEDGALVFLPKIADANVIAGVEILDDSIPHRPATADDKIKVLDK